MTCELVALPLSSGEILHPFCCFHVLQYPLSQNLGVLRKQVPRNGCKMGFGCRVPLTQPAATPHWFVLLCPGFVQSIVQPEADSHAWRKEWLPFSHQQCMCLVKLFSLLAVDYLFRSFDSLLFPSLLTSQGTHNSPSWREISRDLCGSFLC